MYDGVCRRSYALHGKGVWIAALPVKQHYTYRTRSRSIFVKLEVHDPFEAGGTHFLQHVTAASDIVPWCSRTPTAF